jgi:hypothetical protein
MRCDCILWDVIFDIWVCIIIQSYITSLKIFDEIWDEKREELSSVFCACARCRNCSPKQKCVMCNVACETRCVRWERRFLISWRFFYSVLTSRRAVSHVYVSYFTSRISTRYSVSYFTSHISHLGVRQAGSYFTSQLLGWRRVTSHISVLGTKITPRFRKGCWLAY